MSHLKKNILIILSLAFLLLIINSCKVNNDGFYESSIEYYENGKFKKGKIENIKIINSINCIGWIKYYQNGGLKQLRIAKSTIIQGIEFPGNTVIFFTKESKVKNCYLTEDTIIQGYLCRGGSLKVSTSFYPSGKLKLFYPPKELKINGKLYSSSLLSNGVLLNEEGKVIKKNLNNKN